MRRSTADASFRSSVASSHAWSALSDVSLSDVSAISVVCLPISCNDLSNGYHYRTPKRPVIGAPVLLSSTSLPSLPLDTEVPIAAQRRLSDVAEDMNWLNSGLSQPTASVNSVAQSSSATITTSSLKSERTKTALRKALQSSYLS